LAETRTVFISNEPNHYKAEGEHTCYHL